MENRNGKLEQVWSGMGWGLFFILVGILLISDKLGWNVGENGWAYFFIGLGGIFIAGFFVRYFGIHQSFRSGAVSLVTGLVFVVLGIAFIYGYGDWWPIALIPVGIWLLIGSFRGKTNGPEHLQTKKTSDRTC